MSVRHREWYDQLAATALKEGLVVAGAAGMPLRLEEHKVALGCQQQQEQAWNFADIDLLFFCPNQTSLQSIFDVSWKK